MNAEAQKTQRKEKAGESKRRATRFGRRVIGKLARLGRSMLRPYNQQVIDLFESFGQVGELEFGGWNKRQIRSFPKSPHSYGVMFRSCRTVA